MKMALTRPREQCRPHVPPSAFLLPSLPSSLINALFLPMNHIVSQLNPSLPFFHILFCFCLGAFVETMSRRGTCFLRCSRCRVLTLVPAGNTCASSPVLPEGAGGPSVEGPRRLLVNSPTLCHPPPPRFLLPDELWLAGLIVQLRRQNVGSLRGLSNLHLRPLLKNPFPLHQFVDSDALSGASLHISPQRVCH